jgi:hypothetical protein
LKEKTMIFMVIVKATKETEAGVPPDPKIWEAMGKYNKELVEAGVLIAAEGLKPSSAGARVRFSGGATTVIDGPFAETKELIAGFSLLQVSSKEEAIEWVRRSPPCCEGDYEIEIRQVFEMEELAPDVSAERRERKERLRAEYAARK